MNKEFSFEITNESKNAINEILKQQGLRHFKLYTDFYGELDVINYEEYQKLEKEKDKEIERLNKDLQTAIDICNNRQKEIVRLSNMINELEKLIDSYELGKYDYEIPVVILKDKLKELKGENNDNN